MIDAEFNSPAKDADGLGTFTFVTGPEKAALPVSRMAPNPSRFTVRSPSVQVPASSAVIGT